MGSSSSKSVSVQGCLKNWKKAQTIEQKEQVLRNLCDLSCKSGYEVAIFNLAFQVLLDSAKNGQSNLMKNRALVCLSNIALPTENQVPMFQKPGLMDVLMDSVKNGQSNPMKEYALGCLYNIARAKENLVSMFQKPGLMDVLMDSAKIGQSDGIKARALGCLSNIAVADALMCLQNIAIAGENKIPMFEKPGLMDVLQQSAKNGGSDLIKQKALGCLRNIAATGVPKFQKPEDHLESGGGGGDESSTTMLASPPPPTPAVVVQKRKVPDNITEIREWIMESGIDCADFDLIGALQREGFVNAANLSKLSKLSMMDLKLGLGIDRTVLAVDLKTALDSLFA
jgi:type III secretion system FlhB-like substrate exporter